MSIRDSNPTRDRLRFARPSRTICCTAALIALLLCVVLPLKAHSGASSATPRIVQSRAASETISQCGLAAQADDSCKWVRQYCLDDESGLISYLQWYYCDLAKVKPIALGIILLWLCLLFATIGIAASDFFSVNLSTIASLLGLSENLAGVTFLAFGNGSPDVFSTFAAMSTNSGSMAVGELIGAAGFITAVVAGSMALIRPFKVAKASFVRDLSFFLIASSVTMVLLADGQLLTWECIAMVAFYLLYVTVVVTSHWFSGRRDARYAREERARSHFLVQDTNDAEQLSPTTEDVADGIEQQPRRHSSETFSLLESSGLVDQEGYPDAQLQQLAISEINRNMRVNPPKLRSPRPTISAIRPSLVGALEFRSVVSSLQKARRQSSIPINLRRYSDDPTYSTMRRPDFIPRIASTPAGSASAVNNHLHPSFSQRDAYHDDAESARTNRNRAVSMNEATFPSSSRGPQQGSQTSNAHLSLDTRDVYNGPSEAPNPQSLVHVTENDSSHPIDDNFEFAFTKKSKGVAQTVDSSNLDLSDEPPLRAPRRTSSGLLLTPGTVPSSPAAPFPPYHDELYPTVPPSRTGSFKLPPPRLDLNISAQAEVDSAPNFKQLRWWPRNVLPEPEIFFPTLFPTLCRWSQKGVWERLLGIVATPSILLLTITLPVIDSASIEDDYAPEDNEFPSSTVPVVNVTSADEAHTTAMPPLISIDAPSDNANDGIETPNLDPREGSSAFTGEGASIASAVEHRNLTTSPIDTSQSATDEFSSPARTDWNRWLVCVQVFMAPGFVALIAWANIYEDPSLRELVLLEAYTMIGSLLLLALVLTSTEVVKPPRYRPLLCFVGFVVSVAWISTIANEVVGILKALGVIFGISEAILGLTVFAIGNSLGDLVADITIARLGFPVMAFSACIGGPLLNILLGIGLGGLYMTLQENSQAGPRQEFHIEVGSTLLISSVALIMTLLGLLIAVPLNNWMMDRKIGAGLLTMWFVASATNLLIEVTASG